MQPDSTDTPDAITAGKVDLSNCDRELVHMPGLIQPHGVMLVMRPADLAILQASENTAELFGVPAPDLVSKPLADVLGAERAAAVRAAIARAGDQLNRGPVCLLQLPSAAGRAAFDAIAHNAGDVLILELERVSAARNQPLDPYPGVADCVGHLHLATNLTDFLEIAATRVRAFTGFDRVLAYRFKEDGSGEVVAEARRDDLNAYLGQHFPASDIPAPARRLGESEFSALYHEGHGQHILMSALVHECLLVTIFGERTNIGLVRFYAQQATVTLNELLRQAQAKEASIAPLIFDVDFLDDKAAIS